MKKIVEWILKSFYLTFVLILLCALIPTGMLAWGCYTDNHWVAGIGFILTLSLMFVCMSKIKTGESE